MVNHAETVINEIYERLELEMRDEFAGILHERAIAARNHESEHDYALSEMGLSRQEIQTEFEEVFRRFGFERRVHDEDRVMRREING
jgi:hypothetical protein